MSAIGPPGVDAVLPLILPRRSAAREGTDVTTCEAGGASTAPALLARGGRVDEYGGCPGYHLSDV